MLSRLDAIATVAARRAVDPTDGGASYPSEWLGAPSILGRYAFIADFGWLYDDGPPPQFVSRHIDCVRAGQSGCWGHRVNVLSNPLRSGSSCAHPQFVTGVGFAPATLDGASVSQIFEVICARGTLAAGFTWRHAVAYWRIPASRAGASRVVASRFRRGSRVSPRVHVDDDHGLLIGSRNLRVGLERGIAGVLLCEHAASAPACTKGPQGPRGDRMRVGLGGGRGLGYGHHLSALSGRPRKRFFVVTTTPRSSSRPRSRVTASASAHGRDAVAGVLCRNVGGQGDAIE